ncbi:MAG: hybrid sensor histidine kinase/response regulator [Bacteroidetes bacterium HGW-Bacteroidetes-22]|nr:MAG: hybrid sensor histidine kinase/response regulator [Bacteroidetes bacterium HGW-Bacteroidetes-22]
MEQKAELVKAREKAEESDRLKSAFLANISHEIRTPMNGILGFTELLRDNTLDQESRMEYLSIIDKSGRQLLNLINDIIDISKIEAGLMHIQPVNCSLNKVFRETAMMFNSNPKVINKEVELRLKLQFSDEAAWVSVDPMRLSQLLTNLIGNALKFTQKGFVEFGYRLSTENQLLVYCRDTGIGIPADKYKAIFDRFIQVNNTSSRPYEGTGLGLAISQSLTELMEGRLWVESEPGKGSIFYISLPFVPVDQGTSPIFTDEITIEIPNLTGKLILVAEDVPVNFQFLKATIEKTGAEIIWAKNGKLAVERALEEPHPDLILMDLKMPEMNGYEATKLIKKQLPEIPIVAQTAYSLDGDRQKSIEAGCDDHIAKPIQTNELFRILSTLLTPKV